MLCKPFAVVARKCIGTITHVATDDPVAALTFDDGPHPEFTPRLLDLLAKYEARATFFMLGEAAQQHPKLVERIALAGHAIGNHSWDHPSFPLISGCERRGQIQACAEAIRPYGQHLFRPPYGQQCLASHLDALRLGYEVITWNLAVGDWWDPEANRMAELLAQRVRPGSIVILHDALRQHPCAERRPLITRRSCVDRGPMLTALTRFLEQGGNQLRFVTVPELLQHGRPQRQNWYTVAPTG